MATETEVSAFDEFLDAVSKETGDGRDLDLAREIAEEYIVAHPEQFIDYKDLTEHELADAATALNAAGLTTAVTRLEMWVRAKFEPQEIGGQVAATRRVIPGFDDNEGE